MILQINLPKKDEIEKLFIDLMSRYLDKETIKTDFDKFYDTIYKRKFVHSHLSMQKERKVELKCAL